MVRPLVRLAAATLPILASAAAAHAQWFNTRADLNAFLGASLILEDFETYSIANGNANSLYISSLDFNSTANGQGPGLVKPGVTYLDASQTNLQWNGDTYYSLQTKTFLANGTTGELDLIYTTPVPAFGVDLRAFLGYGYTGTIAVYDALGLVDSRNFTLVSGGAESVFEGYRLDAGITSVRIFSQAAPWSPIIDNHAYGNPVPEPATIGILTLGILALAAKRRR